MAKNGVAEHKWWKEAVVYQIYPASFCDTNGDGWGDVPGITSKLDYLKDLGVDVIWLSPIYKSPQADMGYDIADYKTIDPRYGTLEDVDKLIAELKKRDMKLMMDLVVNHTSDQHEWFIQSRSSKDNPYRDFYIWRPPRFDEHGNRQPPNNWAQILGEANSAWTYDEKTGEYYLSLFTPEQPDLNWENPKVREAVHDILDFWLSRGASGFRMDVINLISKDQSFPDAEVTVKTNKYQRGDKFFANGPRLYEYLREMREKVLDRYDTITVGEMPFVRDDNKIIEVVGAEQKALNMIFAFDLVDIDDVPGDFRLTLHHWDARDLKRIINRLQRLMIDRNGWNSLFCENHDQPRSVSRYTDDSDQWRELGAKLLAIMQTTLSGTLYIYQGEELGMRNIPPSWGPEEYKDVEAVNFWKKANAMYAGDPAKLAEARRLLQAKARDNGRTPMQWEPTPPNAGFCPPDVTPWMRVNDDYPIVNAATEMGPAVSGSGTSTCSVRAFWRRMVATRKAHRDVLVYGDFELYDPDHEKVVAFRRFNPREQWLTVFNLSGEPVSWDLPAGLAVREWIVGNYAVEGAPAGKAQKGTLELRPWEALVGILE